MLSFILHSYSSLPIEYIEYSHTLTHAVRTDSAAECTDMLNCPASAGAPPPLRGAGALCKPRPEPLLLVWVTWWLYFLFCSWL